VPLLEFWSVHNLFVAICCFICSYGCSSLCCHSLAEPVVPYHKHGGMHLSQKLREPGQRWPAPIRHGQTRSDASELHRAGHTKADLFRPGGSLSRPDQTSSVWSVWSAWSAWPDICTKGLQKLYCHPLSPTQPFLLYFLFFSSYFLT